MRSWEEGNLAKTTQAKMTQAKMTQAKTTQAKTTELSMPPRRVAILATPSAHSLELAGPVEVFSLVSAKLREAGRESLGGYSVEVISATGEREIRSDSGLTILAHRTFREVDYEPDTLLIAGGTRLWKPGASDALLAWVRARAATARRLGSMCTGAFVLAEAGLLNGKRATTHWYFSRQLQQEYPEVIVDSEPIYIRQGALYTSAGVTAGIDLSIALVEEDFGADIATRIARALVLFLQRPGSQNQFSTSLSLQGSGRPALRDLPVYVLEHLREPLTVEDLAGRASMSVRNFSRVFLEEFEVTPAAFVEKLRVETARRMVEQGKGSFEEIAEACGLGSVESLRRAFQRNFGATPAQLRKAASRASMSDSSL